MVAKKSQGLGTVALKRAAVDCMGGELSVRRQCDLLGISRRAFYYKPQGESKMNLGLMKRIDRIHLQRPFMGTRMMTDRLRLLGFMVNRKRVRRLMRLMGIESLAPGPHTSRPGKGTHHKVYPYLLRDREITGPDQVWCTDITCILMEHGYMYLVAIMDWWSRSVLSWRLSNTMDVEFCLEALQSAVDQTRRVPLIFNTDQGSQFTSMAFTGALRKLGVAVSMDGRGRYLDNIFIERLWRSFKTEEIYLKEYDNVAQLQEGTEDWFKFYNTERPHRSLNRQVPHHWYTDPNEAGGKKADWSDLKAIQTFWS